MTTEREKNWNKNILLKNLSCFAERENVFHVEVESAVLYLTKPKDRDAKRREKAEKRTQVPRQWFRTLNLYPWKSVCLYSQ